MSDTYPPPSLRDNYNDGTTASGEHAQHHNALADAIGITVAELGNSPKGAYASLTARLAVYDTLGLDTDTTTLNALRYGLVGDGATDDLPAALAMLTEAQASGKKVQFPQPPVAYAFDGSLGNGDTGYHGLVIEGLSRAVTFKALSDDPLISGYWDSCNLTNLVLDKDAPGGYGISAQFNRVNLLNVDVKNWSDYAMRLNDGTYGDLGFLNKIIGGNIEQSADGGYGFWSSYRWVDSWLMGVNIGSTLANVRLEGGPARVLGCHLNGAPRYNIELVGNKRVMIEANIMEGSLEESIIYTMPSFLTSTDKARVQIIGNDISNGGKNTGIVSPCIGFYGKDSTYHTQGLSVVGNTISVEDPGADWTRAIKASNADYISAVGNDWFMGHSATEPVQALNCTHVEVVGNHSDNAVATV